MEVGISFLPQAAKIAAASRPGSKMRHFLVVDPGAALDKEGATLLACLVLIQIENDTLKATMIESLDKLFQFQQNALNLRAFRQQLIASNIANADTPGFKARDIDFAAALSRATTGHSVPLRTTSNRHLGAASQNEPATVLYRTPRQPSIDGNTVDMDVERNRFADNAVHYDANLTVLGGQIKLMLAALQG